MFLRTISIAILVCATAVLAGTIWLAHRPSTGCGWADAQPTGELLVVASRVVVRPWFGRHHVYGIFLVPANYRSSRFSARLTVVGSEEPAFLNREKKTMLAASSGQMAVRAYVSTRFALKSLLAGRFGDLSQPCQWRLMLSERTRHAT